MRVFIKFSLVGFLSFIGFSACGNIPTGILNGNYYNANTVFIGENNDKILEINKENLHYKLIDEKFIKINTESYLKLRNRHVKTASLNQNIVHNIENFVVNKYNLKTTDTSNTSKIETTLLLNNELNYEKDNFLVVWSDYNQTYNRMFYVQKTENSFIENEISPPLEINNKINVNIEPSLDLLVNNREYILFSRQDLNKGIMYSHDEKYIPILNIQRNKVIFHTFNNFIEVFYGVNSDYKQYIKPLITKITLYEDGMYLLYINNLRGQKNEIKYYFVPYDTSTKPIVLNVPLK